MRPRLGVAVLLVLLAVVPSAGAAKPFRIGMVIPLGWRPSQNDIAGLMYRGFIRAAHTPGVEGRVVFANTTGDPAPAISFLARRGYDVIVTPLLPSRLLAPFERRYSHTLFLIPDAASGTPHAAPNELTTVFASQEAAYLGGYLAALVEARRPTPHIISAVGGIPQVQQVRALIAGFSQGARAADPHVRVLVNYSHDFVDPKRCAAVAREQIERGAGVVFNVAGACGLGALSTARRFGAWGVGVDADQSSLGPFILTSVLKHEDAALIAAIDSIHRRRLPQTRTLVFDSANDGVGLGRISPRVPAALRARLERVRADIVAGRIRVSSGLKAGR
jgi:basic membrane protein A